MSSAEVVSLLSKTFLMKRLFTFFIMLSFYFVSSAQETKAFPATEFATQLDKLLCAGKNDFGDLIGKMVTGGGDTTWKSNLSLPGFNSANFSKGKTMIDYAFVAYQPFTNASDASAYYDQVKKAIDGYPGGDCIKIAPARIPMEVQGVEKSDLWKSTTVISYKNYPKAVLYLSLSLDREHEVVINAFLR